MNKPLTILDYLDQIEEEQWSLDEEKSCYQIQDSIEAENTLAYYKRKKAKIDGLIVQADYYLKKAQENYEKYLREVVSPMQEELKFLEDKLRVYAEQELNKTKKKSLKLVEGTLSFRKNQDKYIHDDKAILEYVLANKTLKDYIIPTPGKLDWSKMKEDGEFKTETDMVGNQLEKFYVHGIEVPNVTIQRNIPPTFTIK